MLKFASACRRCLSKAANMRRLYGSYSLPSDLRTSAKNHSRVPFSSCLGITSSLWGSFRHVLHASKRFTHVFVDFVVFLFKFFSSTICRTTHTLGFTRQKLRKTALQWSQEKCGEFLAEIPCLDPNMFIWLDETGCDRLTIYVVMVMVWEVWLQLITNYI